ncbi:MAG: helix-turn-helix transcriptional regulator, partial [Mycobacterium sp.]
MRVIHTAIVDPQVAGIVICGSTGVGKSRIAREALRSAASNGCETRWAAGTSSAREIPLGAFASWAPATATATLHAVRGVIDALTSAPKGALVVIGVDDVNLLDDLSAFVLHRIVQQGAAKLILTFRDRDPVPAATEEVWAAGQFDRLDLQPLSRDDTAQLLSATLGGHVHPDDASRLWRLTRGNVLYLRNIVEQEVADGRLARQHDSWRWIGDPVVPPGLVDLIESRIGALSGAVSDVLDALAVGEPIELAALVRITDAAAVEEADTRGLVSVERVDGRPEVRLGHPLHGEVRRNRAAPTRLRRMRGLVAAELASCDSGDTRTTVRRATLSVDSDLTPDPELLATAAQDAVWLADLELADRLADAAIRADGGPEAYFVRAEALSWLGRAGDADAVLCGLPQQGLTDADRAKAVFLRATNMFWLVDPTTAKKIVDDAAHTTPSSARGCIDAFLTQYWAVMGKPDAARKASKILALEQLPSIAAAVAAAATTLACGDTGRTADAVTAAHTGYGIAERAHDAAQMRFGIADVHVGALVLSGRVGEACGAAERLRQRAIDLPGPTAQLHGATVAGRAALGAGHLDTACSLLEPAVELLLASDDYWTYLAQLFHSIALAMRGSTEAAAAALGALEAHPRWRCLDYARALAHAWVAAGQGAVREAINRSWSAAQTAKVNGQFAAEVMCLQTAAQFGDHTCAPRLDELATIVEGPRV